MRDFLILLIGCFIWEEAGPFIKDLVTVFLMLLFQPRERN